MAVNSRVKFVAQQRVDLHDMLAMDSFTAFDFRALISALVGTDRAYIVRGFEVVGKSGLNIKIKVADSQVFNPQDNNGSFYVGLAGDPDVSIDLPADQSNIFVEAAFSHQSTSPVNRGLWDALALTGEDASGVEYSSSIDFEDRLVLSISINTVGFTEGAIPLLRASTSTSAITNMIDCRPLLFRLGTGGTTPDPLAKYGWSSVRAESVVNGVGVGDAIDSPWRAKDPSGSINDKAFKSFKNWADAVMTRIAEISGSAIWYSSGAGVTPVVNLSLNQVFFDALGHNIQPSKNSAFVWKNVLGGLRLVGSGFVSSPSEGLIKWKSNYGGLEWHLGDTFTNASARTYNSHRFMSPIPADNGNIYLKLEREVSKGSGAPVSWADNSSYTGFPTDVAVSGVAGDFTGIALGDYIRKESEGFSRYYQVVAMSDGVTQWTIASDPQKVADGTIKALKVKNINNPAGIIIGGASTEPLKFFRSRYSSADLFADSTIDTYNFQDADYYWLGRRSGTLFFLRGYGLMQEGTEVTTLDHTWANGRQDGSPLILERSYNSVYDGTDLKLRDNSAQTIITIKRYVRDNTVESPIPGTDNSDALLTYTITAPITSFTSGQGLWVKLSNSSGGALSNGNITDTTDAETNIDTNTNLWEIRDLASTPARTFDNKDVHLIAVATTIGGYPAVLFVDGTVININGNLVNNHAEIMGDLKLKNRPQESVLFISDTTADLVDTDVANFFYDKTGGIFGLFNFRFANNLVTLATPTDVDFLPNLANNTLTIGGPGSTTLIPGDLVVSGNTVAAQVSQIQAEDKVITLGVGNPLNGGFDSGIEVADNTINAVDLSSVVSTPDVVITLASAPGYSVGDIIGVSSTDTIADITSGQISGSYTIVNTLSIPGDATISGTTLTIRTAQNASATVNNQTALNTKVFRPEWDLKVTGSDGDPTGITSWRFKVKNQTTAPTLTPVAGYGIVPTAHSTNMESSLIPFVNDDNAGPGGKDTTLDFDSSFSFNKAAALLTVPSLNVNGKITVNTLATYVTSNYTVTGNDTLIPVDTTAAASDVIITLPASTTATRGRMIMIKDAGGVCSQTNKRIIIDANGSETIDGDLILILENDWGSFTLVDGGNGNWHVI